MAMICRAMVHHQLRRLRPAPQENLLGAPPAPRATFLTHLQVERAMGSRGRATNELSFLEARRRGRRTGGMLVATFLEEGTPFLVLFFTEGHRGVSSDSCRLVFFVAGVVHARGLSWGKKKF